MDKSQHNMFSSYLAEDGRSCTSSNSKSTANTIKPELKQSKLNPAAAVFVPSTQKQQPQVEPGVPLLQL